MMCAKLSILNMSSPPEIIMILIDTITFSPRNATNAIACCSHDLNELRVD